MKYIAVLSIFFMVTCALTPSSHQVSSLQYDKVQNFTIGVSKEADIVEALGVPANRFEKNQYYTLTYNDPVTGFQRLSVNFTKKLKQALRV